MKLFLAIALLATPVLADIITFGVWRYSVENGEATIIDYSGEGGAVVIPSEVDGILVRQVGGGWGTVFGGINTTNVTIPNSVTRISQSAFAYSTNLINITIPNSVTSIGNTAFYGCTSLTSIAIPDSVTSIGTQAFYGCTSLTSIAIPDSVTYIGENVFLVCPNLTNVIIPSKFLSRSANMSLEGMGYHSALINNLANTLATNTTFINNLAQAIISASNNYGLATQAAITTATSNLVTQSEITTFATKTELTNSLAQSRTDGINSVLSNPNLWTLYTTNQISAMAIGDLVLTRTNNGSFVLNYDIEQSEDLVNWTPYQGFAMPLTNLPANKAFVRIKAKQ